MNLKNMKYFFVGPLIVGLTGIITIPMLAWYMPTDDLGRINIIQICISFAIVVAAMGLDQFYARNFYENINKKQLALHCLLPGIAILTLISAYAIGNKEELMQAMFSLNSKLLLIPGLLVLIVVNYLNVFTILTLRMNQSGMKYTMAIVMPKIIILLSIPLLMVFSENSRLEFYVLIMIMAGLSGLVYSFIYGFKVIIFSKEKFTWNWVEFRCAINYGLPMLGSSLIYWVMTSSNSIILKKYTSLDELGKYTLIISIAGVAGVIQSIVTTIWTPIAYRWNLEVNNKNNYILATSFVSILASIVILLVSAFSSIVLTFLPSKYNELESLLPLAVIPIMFYTISEVSAIGIALANKTVFNMIATTIGCSINILISLLIVEEYGLKGVLISSALAHYVFLIFRTVFSCRVCFSQPLYKLFTSSFLCMLFSIVMASCVMDEWVKILASAALLAAIMIMYTREIIQFLNVFTTKSV